MLALFINEKKMLFKFNNDPVLQLYLMDVIVSGRSSQQSKIMLLFKANYAITGHDMSKNGQLIFHSTVCSEQLITGMMPHRFTTHSRQIDSII